jgi:hypothetical protein
LEDADRYLQKATRKVMKFAKQSLDKLMDTMTVERLLMFRNLLPGKINCKESAMRFFSDKVRDLQPKLFEYSPEQVKKSEQRLSDAVDEMIEREISEWCLQRPSEIFEILLQRVKRNIERVIEPVLENESITLDNCILSIEMFIGRAEQKLRHEVCILSESLLSTEEFEKCRESFIVKIQEEMEYLKKQVSKKQKRDQTQKRKGKKMSKDLKDIKRTGLAPTTGDPQDPPKSPAQNSEGKERSWPSPLKRISEFLGWHSNKQ